MEETFFEESKNQPIVTQRQALPRGIVGFLIKSKIASTERQANFVIAFLIVVTLIASAALLFFQNSEGSSLIKKDIDTWTEQEIRENIMLYNLIKN